MLVAINGRKQEALEFTESKETQILCKQRVEAAIGDISPQG